MRRTFQPSLRNYLHFAVPLAWLAGYAVGELWQAAFQAVRSAPLLDDTDLANEEMARFDSDNYALVSQDAGLALYVVMGW